MSDDVRRVTCWIDGEGTEIIRDAPDGDEDVPTCALLDWEEFQRLRAEVERLTGTMLTRQGGDRVLERHLRSQIITDEQIDRAWTQVRWFREQGRHTEAGNIEAAIAELGIIECRECGGSGIPTPYEVGSGESCHRCHGHGWVREERGDE